MDSSLHEVWQAASSSPFLPAIGKNTQFLVAFVLLVAGVSLTSVFALSKSNHETSLRLDCGLTLVTDRSFVNVFALGVPASLAIAYDSSLIILLCVIANQKQVRNGLHVLCGRSVRLRYPLHPFKNRIGSEPEIVQ